MRALDLNDVGQVCGWMNAPGGGGYVAFVWNGQDYTVIERPAWVNTMEAHGINNAGQVVGTMADVVTGPVHAFIWQDGALTDLGPRSARRIRSHRTSMNGGTSSDMPTHRIHFMCRALFG